MTTPQMIPVFTPDEMTAGDHVLLQVLLVAGLILLVTRKKGLIAQLSPRLLQVSELINIIMKTHFTSIIYLLHTAALRELLDPHLMPGHL